MQKIIAIVSGVFMLLSPALASGPNRVPAHVTKTRQSVNVVIPTHAVEVADGVFDLGHTIDRKGRAVRGYAFVHYKDEYAHREGHVKSGGNTTSSCYAFLAKDARWKTTEPYLFDPTNARLLDETTLRAQLATSAESWNTQVAFDVFGIEKTGTVDPAAIGTLNEKNEVLFGDIASPGAIAVTIAWGIFYGPPSGRELVEWDMVFDDVSFDWSIAGEAGKMDFWNIAAHEIGHAAGMGHPSDGCAEETMYRYADYSETKKRDLNTGDIAGIKALYK